MAYQNIFKRYDIKYIIDRRQMEYLPQIARKIDCYLDFYAPLAPAMYFRHPIRATITIYSKRRECIQSRLFIVNFGNREKRLHILSNFDRMITLEETLAEEIL